MDRKVMQAVSLTALNYAVNAEGLQQSWTVLMFSFLVRLGFSALLRPGEIFNLLRGDLRFIDRGGAENCIVIAIRSPKTASKGGRTQFALAHGSGLYAYGHWILQGLIDSDPLWPFSPATFRKVLDGCLRELNCHEIGYTPGSLRPGGTTDRVLGGEEVSRLQWAGRWLAAASMKAYVQEAVSHYAWTSIPVSAQNSIHQLISQFGSFLTVPPSVPWQLVLVAWRTTAGSVQLRDKKFAQWRVRSLTSSVTA